MGGDHAFLRVAIAGPLDGANKNRVPPDDRAGVPRAVQRAFPEHILLGGTAQWRGRFFSGL